MISPEHPTLTKIDAREWRVEIPIRFRLEGYPAFIVPAGFITDGATVFWGLWNLFPPMGGKYTNAAIGHDWLCVQGKSGHPIMSYDRAHEFFADAMEFSGVGKFRRYTMGKAVKWFGPRW